MMAIRWVVSRLSIVRRLMEYLWQERMWWLIPLVIILLTFSGLLFFSQSSVVAPFIYTLF